MIHSQLSNSKVHVCESSGKRLKSMLQAAVTVTLGTRTMYNTDENTETHCLRSLYFIIFHKRPLYSLSQPKIRGICICGFK